MTTIDEAREKCELDGNIYIFCRYDYKETAKNNGFKWSPLYKLWYIPSDKLTEDVMKFIYTVKYANKTTNGDILYYHVYLQRKEEVLERLNNMSV